MLSWLFFQRYLFSQRAGSLIKKIAWLSMASIGVAIMAFILVLSVMSGLHQNINLRILALEPHLIVEFNKNSEDSEILSHKIVGDLKTQASEGVDFQLFDRQDVFLRTVDGIFHGAVARGVTASTLEFMLKKLSELPSHAQSSATPTFEIPEQDEVILGSSLAKQMNIYEGDYITVLPPESLLMAPGENPPFSKVLVKQIISTNIVELDTQMLLFQRGKALVNFSKAGSRKVGFDIWLEDPYDASAFKDSLAQYTDLKVETWRERNSAVFLALRLEKFMLGSFLGLSALITTFSIWSVLTLLITQKKREMGLLMSIGFSSRGLKELFQRLGLYLAGIGLGVGALAGVCLSLYIEYNPLRVLPDIYYDSEIPAKVDFLFLLMILGLAIAVIYGAVSLSMNRILNLKPSEALRSN